MMREMMNLTGVSFLANVTKCKAERMGEKVGHYSLTVPTSR